MPDALPAATLPIYLGLGPASRDTEMCHRWLGYFFSSSNMFKLSLWTLSFSNSSSIKLVTILKTIKFASILLNKSNLFIPYKTPDVTTLLWNLKGPVELDKPNSSTEAILNEVCPKSI